MIITNEKTGKSISFTYSKKQDLIKAANRVSDVEEDITDRKLRIEGKPYQIMYDIQEEVIKQIQYLSFLGEELQQSKQDFYGDVGSLNLTPIRITKVFVSEVGNVSFE